VLGGGFDTTLFKPEVVRATAKGVRLFEVDRYPTQKLKCDAVEAAGLDTTHITYVPCDFIKENWLDCLKLAGFDVNKKTYILWEGVTYYLDKSAVSATLKLFTGFFNFSWVDCFGYLLLGCSIISASFIICMLTLLLMTLTGLHFCVGFEFVTPSL
jgi:O-methyltransferase involved in polyketide biosynthesis